jgi:hypothetical protein
LHHLQRKPRRHFNQPQESFFVNGGNAAISSCHSGGAAGLSIDECHFAEQTAGTYALYHRACQVNLDGSFDHRKHAVPRVSLFEDRLTLLERTNVRFATQDIECWHVATILSKLTEANCE